MPGEYAPAAPDVLRDQNESDARKKRRCARPRDEAAQLKNYVNESLPRFTRPTTPMMLR
jgi:hypothetical protein